MDMESDRRAHLEMMRALRRDVGLKRPPEELLRRFEEIQEERVRRLAVTWLPGMDLNREVLATLLREEGMIMNEAHWEAFREAHWREHLRWLRPYPEVEGVLQGLRETGLHIGLLSDVDEDFLQLCFYALPLEGYLDSVTTSEEVGVAKPHQAIFQRALSKAGCEAHQAVHVGDSPERDAVGARRMGMSSVLIATDGGDGRADYVVPSLEQAYGVLRRLMQGDLE